MSEIKTMMVAGANGFMGRYISRHFLEKGWRVFGLARRTKGLAVGVEFIRWDGETLEASWKEVLEGVDVLINLAGRTVDCRYNDENKRQILDSRVTSTKILGNAVAGCASPPSVWMNASTATIYASTREKAQTESEGVIGDGFSVEIAKTWEAAFNAAEVDESVRKITLRTTLVMGDEKGTVLDVLSGLARKYLGGKMGDGGQMVSWIDVNDLCRAVEWMIEDEAASGEYNLAAPEALTNAEMMRRIRERVGVRFGLPASEWMLEVGAFFMRTETELILKSRWVYPERLIEEGFVFEKEEF
ncbi:MAG: hypothetical protein ACI9E1_000736 [Cryomorphaceae bacterium]|jgi:uncharacterized protein (TIGR01777 family)